MFINPFVYLYRVDHKKRPNFSALEKTQYK